MKKIALIIAGGTGNRMGQDIPKQFMVIDECPVIVKTLLSFESHPDIDSIAVVCLSGWETFLQSYANQYSIKKLNWIIEGGVNGQDSIRNGLNALRTSGCADDDIVLIHDAVRPMVSHAVISCNIETCLKKGNAITAIKCIEAILESHDGESASVSIPRDKLFRTQTPQTFRLGEILDAHAEALAKGITNSVSSCTMMIELGGRTLHIAQGEEKNLKITNLEDISIYKSLLHTEKENWLK